MEPTEINIPCDNGLNLKALSWKGPEYSESSDKINNGSNNHILMCHGWLDNAATFYILGPRLSKELPHAHIVALDFPGHGHSDHLPLSAPSGVMANFAYFVRQTLRQLDWVNSSTQQESATTKTDKSITYIGHSMGAAVGTIYAASFPEDVSQLILLEGAGPLSRPESDIAKHIRCNLIAHETRGKKPVRIYPSLQKAIETRQKTVQNYPGNQSLSIQAATQLVLRGSKAVDTNNDDIDDNNVDADASVTSDNEESVSKIARNTEEEAMQGRQFIHDTRLSWPSVQYMTDNQVLALYDAITCPTFLILADNGWPIDSRHKENIHKRLNPTSVTTLSGSHHFHADPETATAVGDAVLAAIRSKKGNVDSKL